MQWNLLIVAASTLSALCLVGALFVVDIWLEAESIDGTVYEFSLWYTCVNGKTIRFHTHFDGVDVLPYEMPRHEAKQFVRSSLACMLLLATSVLFLCSVLCTEIYSLYLQCRTDTKIDNSRTYTYTQTQTYSQTQTHIQTHTHARKDRLRPTRSGTILVAISTCIVAAANMLYYICVVLVAEDQSLAFVDATGREGFYCALGLFAALAALSAALSTALLSSSHAAFVVGDQEANQVQIQSQGRNQDFDTAIRPTCDVVVGDEHSPLLRPKTTSAGSFASGAQIRVGSGDDMPSKDPDLREKDTLGARRNSDAKLSQILASTGQSDNSFAYAPISPVASALSGETYYYPRPSRHFRNHSSDSREGGSTNARNSKGSRTFASMIRNPDIN